MYKMATFHSNLWFVVLLMILKSRETWCMDYDFEMGLRPCKNKYSLRERMEAFDDMGYVRLEVSGEPYVIRGGPEIVDGTYTSYYFDGNLIINETHDENLTSRVSEAEDNLLHLKALSLETTELHNVNSNTFRWAEKSSLVSLILRNMSIEDVAEDTLVPVRDTLRVLDIGHVNISVKDLSALMRGLYNESEENPSILIVLSMAHLGLMSVPYDALQPVQYSLRALSLFGNHFRTINTSSMMFNDFYDEELDELDSEMEASKNEFINLQRNYNSNTSIRASWARFPKMPYLHELDLRDCHIDVIGRGSFVNLANLQKLFLSENYIVTLPSFAFEGLTYLSVLDISQNRANPTISQKRGLIIQRNSFADLLSLKTINLSYTQIRQRSFDVLNRLPESLYTLNLCQTSISDLTDGVFAKLSNLHVLDLSYNPRLGEDLTAASFSGLTMLHELYLARTSLPSLTELEELTSLRVLDAKRNNIGSLEDLTDKFPGLEIIDVSFNHISSWRDERIIGSTSKLEALFLHSNSLSLMSEQMLEDFKSLSYLTLGDNSFVCNCPLKSFMEYLIDSNNGSTTNLPVLVDYQPNGTSHTCTDVSSTRTIPFVETSDYCLLDTTRYWLSALQHGVYIGLLVLVCGISVGSLIYWKWWYIRYIAILIKNATVLSMMNIENCEDRIYMYDIFVSYSDENRNWVIEELIPNIEGPDSRFSICLHERDFQVGVSILENIIMGMDQSRTILLILSGCFLKSQWCQFEMHLAQHRLLETCREELVLVLLEEIPRRKRPKILHYLMMVKTYIVWPKNSEDKAARILFWKRLRRAITANKSKKTSVA